MLTINVNGNTVDIQDVDTLPADNISADSSGFEGNLSTDIVTVQDALAEIDALSLGGGGEGSIKHLRTLKVSLTKEQIEQLHTNNIDILPSLPANQYYVFISEKVKIGTNNYNSNVAELGYPEIQTSYNNGVRPIYLSPAITNSYINENNSLIRHLGNIILNTPINDAEFIDNLDWTYKFDIRACKIVMSTIYYYDEVNEEIKPTQIIDLGGSTGLDIVYTYLVYDDEGNIIPYEDSVPSSSISNLSTIKVQVITYSEADTDIVDKNLDDDFIPIGYVDNVYTNEPHTVNLLADDSVVSDATSFVTVRPYTLFFNTSGTINSVKKIRLFTSSAVNFTGKFLVYGFKKNFLI